MSTAAYGVEAIWDGQKWLLDGFNKLSAAISRAVVGPFSTTEGRMPSALLTYLRKNQP
jgi:hypothetical protein